MGLWGSIKNTVKKIASPVLTVAGIATGNPLLTKAGLAAGTLSALSSSGSGGTTSSSTDPNAVLQGYVTQMADNKQGYSNLYNIRNNQLGAVASDLLGYVNGDSSNTNGSAPATLYVPTSDEVLSTRPELKTYEGSLVNPTKSDYTLSPRIDTTTDLSKATATPTSSANTNLGKLGQVATYDSSGMPSADTLLGVLNDTPDPDQIESKVVRAYNQINDTDLNKEVADQQAELDADAARRGLTGSNISNSAKIGLRNWQRSTGAEQGAEGVLAGINAAANARSERTSNAEAADTAQMNRYELAQDLASKNREAQENYANSLDTQDTNLRQEAIDRMLKQQEANLAENQDRKTQDQSQSDLNREYWNDVNNTTGQNRDWFNEDQSAKDSRWLSDEAIASDLHNEKTQNMWNALNWLSSDTNRLGEAADLTPLINAENGVISNNNQASQIASQNSANKNNLWAALLSAAGTAYGAYKGAKS
ncbi:MAG: hypothetical protein ABFD83_13895 [Armatimonadota bacterium]